jgi:hypothetical protein
VCQLDATDNKSGHLFWGSVFYNVHVCAVGLSFHMPQYLMFCHEPRNKAIYFDIIYTVDEKEIFFKILLFVLEMKFGTVIVKQLWLRYALTIAGVKRDAAVVEQHGNLRCL